MFMSYSCKDNSLPSIRKQVRHLSKEKYCVCMLKPPLKDLKSACLEYLLNDFKVYISFVSKTFQDKSIYILVKDRRENKAHTAIHPQ